MSKNRFLARPEKTNGQAFPETSQFPEISVSGFQAGLNTEDDPSDIPDDAFVQAQNIRIRNQRVTRREGVSLITPAKPDTRSVKILSSLKEYSGELIQLRATPTSLHRRGAVSWLQIVAGVGPAFNKAPNNFISVDDRHFFATDGSVNIKEINLTTDTYNDLGNANRYRYITAFGDRLVGYNAGNGNPVEVAWSGNINYDEWNPLVDPTAGSVSLVESQSDYADFGTGIFGFADRLLLLKERSIWLAAKTGAGTNPFYFFVTSPSFGCDTPTSVQKVPNGIIYYDRRTSNVYQFDVTNPTPIAIGRSVADSILAAVEDPAAIFSGFDPVNLEYYLGVPNSSSVTIFVYSFKTSSWWTEVRENVSCVSSLDFGEPTTLIQDLVGNIQDLVGTIAGLGSAGYPKPTIFFGKDNGDTEIDDESVNTGHTTILISKTWTSPRNSDFFVQRLAFTYETLAAGTMTISYSKDSGVTYTVYKIVTLGTLGLRNIVTCAKSVRSRQFSWKIESSVGRFALVDFKALTAPAGYSLK